MADQEGWTKVDESGWTPVRATPEAVFLKARGVNPTVGDQPGALEKLNMALRPLAHPQGLGDMVPLLNPTGLGLSAITGMARGAANLGATLLEDVPYLRNVTPGASLVMRGLRRLGTTPDIPNRIVGGVEHYAPNASAYEGASGGPLSRARIETTVTGPQRAHNPFAEPAIPYGGQAYQQEIEKAAKVPTAVGPQRSVMPPSQGGMTIEEQLAQAQTSNGYPLPPEVLARLRAKLAGHTP